MRRVIVVFLVGRYVNEMFFVIVFLDATENLKFSLVHHTADYFGKFEVFAKLT